MPALRILFTNFAFCLLLLKATRLLLQVEPSISDHWLILLVLSVFSHWTLDSASKTPLFLP